MSTHKILLLFIPTIFLASACRIPKDVIYLENVSKADETSAIIESYEAHQQYITYIQPDDILAITVNNSAAPEAALQFNLPTVSFATPNEQKITSTPSLQTYLVDREGNINFPVLGRVKLGGMSKPDAIKYLEEEIGKIIANPIVTIQFMNYKIAVMGEVLEPGQFTLENERVSIFDALSLAKDMTINGKRTDVLVIRDNNGTIETHRLDLTSAEVFQSPYYYLQQNDIVYVTPNKARQKNARYSQAEQMNITIISTVVSAVATLSSLGISLIHMYGK